MPYIKKQLVNLFDHFWDNKIVKTDLFLQIYEINPIILLTDGYIKIPFFHKNFKSDLEKNKSNSFLVNSILIVHNCKLKIKIINKKNYFFILKADKIDLLCPGMFLSNWGKPKYIRTFIKPYKRNIIHKLILIKIKNFENDSEINPEIIFDIKEEDKFEFNNLVIFKRIISENQFFKKMKNYADMVFEVIMLIVRLEMLWKKEKNFLKLLKKNLKRKMF